MTTNTNKPTAKKSVKPKQSGQAKLLNSATVMSAATSEAFSKSMFPDLELEEVIVELEKNVEGVIAGDMTSLEAMLVGQANSLQTIFVSLARRAASQEYLKQYSMYMTLALKAQSQSRATIQALIELKFPKQVAFVKQANISHGHQQVNNGNNPNARAKNITNQPNELIEANNGSTAMDVRTATKASKSNKAMATLEK